MKKRRELDALVGHGKLRRKCRGSGQELLRPAGEEEDTDSSDTEFTVPAQKAISRKRSRSSVCTTCLTVSGFLVLVACLVACGTLLWMHFALRKNLNYFQKKLERVESHNQCTPEEFQRLHTQIQELNKTLNNFKDGKDGLQTVLSKVNLLTKAVAELKGKTTSLDERVAKAPLLQTLPKKVETTSKSLANLGSDMDAFKRTVNTLKKEHKQAADKYEALTQKLKALADRSNVNPSVSPVTDHLDKKIDAVSAEIDKLNSTSIEDVNALRKQMGTLGDKMNNEVLKINEINATVLHMSAQLYALNASDSKIQDQIHNLQVNLVTSTVKATTKNISGNTSTSPLPAAKTTISPTAFATEEETSEAATKTTG